MRPLLSPLVSLSVTVMPWIYASHTDGMLMTSSPRSGPTFGAA
jgi:hypothetical protein